ncbi:uncharacterized protein [Branchiostoma lanceolatum]|uniref:uncharacterized protein isoform X1 n=1 Tax=Branchiostoma lanceolatum TaxID=7740 RepID=UPI003454B60D
MDAISGTRRQVLLGLYLAGGWLPGARAQTAGCGVSIPGLAAGCVLGTLALCLIAFGIYFLVSRKKAKKRTALQTIAGGPGDLEAGFPEGRSHPSHAYVIENPHTKDEQKNGSQKTKAAAGPPVGTTNRDLSTEEAVPGDDSYLVLLDKKEEDQSSGFNIMKGDNGRIFIQDVRQGGPAWKSGKIHDGDQLVSVTVYFTDIAYEDALTILSYSSPYKVQLRLRKPSKRPSPVAKTVPVTIEMQPVAAASVSAASVETQQDAAKVLQPIQAATIEQVPAVVAETQQDVIRMELQQQQQQQPVHEPEVLETLEPLPSPEDRLPEVWGVEVVDDDGDLSERKHNVVVNEANRIVDDAFESAKEELRREEKLLRENIQQPDTEKPLTPRLERRLSSTSLPGAFPEEATWKSPNPYPSNLPEIKFTGQSKSLDHLNKSVETDLPDDMRPRSLADIDFSKYIPPPTEPPPPMTPDTPKPVPPERGSARKKRKAPPPPPPTVTPPTPTVSPPSVSPIPQSVSPPPTTVSPPPTSVSPTPPSVSPPLTTVAPPPLSVCPLPPSVSPPAPSLPLPSVSPIAKEIPSEFLTNVTAEKEEDRRKDELTDSGLELSITTPNQEAAPALLPPPPPAVLQTHASQDGRAPDNAQEEKSTSPSGDSGINVDIGTVEPPLLSPPVVPTILPGKGSILEQKIEEQAQESAQEFQNFLDSQPEQSLLPAAPAAPVPPTPLEEDQVIAEEKETPERSRYSPSALTRPFTLPPVDLRQTPTEELVMSSSSESESEPDDSKYKNIRVDEVDKKRSSMSSEPPEEERPGSTEGVFLATMVSVASSEEGSSSEEEAEPQDVTMSPPSAKQLRDQFFNDMKPTSGLENNIMSPGTHPVNNTEEIHETRTPPPTKQIRASTESSENLLDSISQQQANLDEQAGTSGPSLPSLVDPSKPDSRGGLQGVNGTPEGSFMV